MKTIAWVLLLSIATTGFAADLPDAPSVSRSKAQFRYMGGVVNTPTNFEDEPAPRLSFSERHRKAIIWTGVGIGVTIGAIVGILKHSGHCPSKIFYEGEWYPYSGTYDDQHPCPTEPPGVH